METNTSTWHKKVYDQIIERGKERGLDKKKLTNDYYEKHHILPRCLGGTDSEDNLVLLTYREHIICHKLLTKIYPNESSLAYSVSLMLSLTVKEENGRKVRVKTFSNSKEAHVYKVLAKELDRKSGRLEKLAKELSERYKGKQFAVLSDESKDKLSKSLTGKKKSKEHVENFKNSIKDNPPSGRKIINSEGRIFLTVKECSEYYKKSSTTIIRWISSGKFGLKYLDGKSKRFSRYPIKCPDGTICITIKDCMKKYSRSEKTIKLWIQDPSKDFSYVTDTPLPSESLSKERRELISKSLRESNKRTTKRIQGPDGEIYESLETCAKHWKKDRHTISKWIKNHPEKGFKYL